jgi:hypothetical protein
MGSKIAKKRPKGGGERKKRRVWVRDLSNLIGGAVVGGLIVFIASAYVAGKESKAASRIFAEDVTNAVPALKALGERYLEATDGKSKDAKDLMEGVDISKPVHPLEVFRNSLDSVGSLNKACVVRLLDLYRNLDEADLYRRLILEVRVRPDQTMALMQRGFLRALYEGSQMTGPLLLDLNAKKPK